MTRRLLLAAAGLASFAAASLAGFFWMLRTVDRNLEA